MTAEYIVEQYAISCSYQKYQTGTANKLNIYEEISLFCNTAKSAS